MIVEINQIHIHHGNIRLKMEMEHNNLKKFCLISGTSGISGESGCSEPVKHGNDCPSSHCHHLSRSGSWWQQTKQSSPDILLSSHVLQLLLENMIHSDSISQDFPGMVSSLPYRSFLGPHPETPRRPGTVNYCSRHKNRPLVSQR